MSGEDFRKMTREELEQFLDEENEISQKENIIQQKRF